MDKKMYDYWLYGLEFIGKKTYLRLKENGYDGLYLYQCSEEKLPVFLGEKQKASIIIGKRKSRQMIQDAYEKIKSSILTNKFLIKKRYSRIETHGNSH